MRLNEAIASYTLQLRADGRSEHTVRQYQRHLAAFAGWLGERDLDAITTTDVAHFMVTTETTQGRSTATLNAVRSSLRTFFAHAHAAGYSRSNPARLLRLAIRAPAPPRGLSEDEVARLMDALTLAQGPVARRDHLLVDVMLRAGLRLGSALALDKADVDLERRELVVRIAKRDQPERVVVCQALLDHLVGYLAERGDGPLFTGPGGGRIGRRQAQRRVERWMRQARIANGSAHSLRHSFALRLYSRTHDLLVVQRALRHRSIASTMTYARANDADLRRAIEA
jgi:integrase/recombinase XerC